MNRLRCWHWEQKTNSAIAHPRRKASAGVTRASREITLRETPRNPRPRGKSWYRHVCQEESEKKGESRRLDSGFFKRGSAEKGVPGDVSQHGASEISNARSGQTSPQRIRGMLATSATSMSR